MAVTSADLTRLRTKLGLSHRELADFLDVKEATIKRWESGSTKVHGTEGKIFACFILFEKKYPHLFTELASTVRTSLAVSPRGIGYVLDNLLEYYAGVHRGGA